ncbi:hypothetical protein GCM10009633_23910 [Janibacter melonis]|uniref:hypothetical protein n=1 Tax=Janibacter melonis TaxID=262209 RepID=UPI001E3FB7C7|nr:hypothetical protein [Janibacter melonis]MCB5993219.1 hypothetical protein [Janibacter melonis]
MVDATPTPFEEAQQTGERVELVDLREESAQFFVNPDGSKTAEIAAAPERVRQQDGSWADVDLTLVTRSDGSVGPKVSAGDVSFSAGGTAPVVRVGAENVALSVSMPVTLPTPVLDGPVATYSEVYPGVDLRMTAVGSSFRQELVVKDREASQNPALRSIAMSTQATGGSMDVVDDALVVRDDSDKVVLRGAPAAMWDSSGGATTSDDAEVTPSTESLGVEPVEVSASGSGGAATLTLTPSADFLEDTSTEYPVVIDPSVDRLAYTWAMVNKTFPDQEYYKWSDQDQGVGYNSYEGTHGKRLYWSFSIPSALKSNDVVMKNAYLSAWSTFSATCAPGAVRLYRTGSFDWTTTWNSRPAVVGDELDRFTGKAGYGCQDSGAGLRAEMRLGAGLRGAIDGGHDRLNLGMISTDETSNDGWFRFAGPENDTTWKRPKLAVDYNTKPTTPGWDDNFTIAGSTCQNAAQWGKYVNPDGHFAATAMASDPDAADQVRAEVQWWDAYPLEKVQDGFDPGSSTFMTNKQVANKSIPQTLSDGTHFARWRIVDQSGAASGWSPDCPFYVDQTPPSTPTITIVGHDSGDLVPIGSTQRFRISSSSDAAEIRYQWRVNGDATTTEGTPSDGTPTELTHEVKGSRVELRAFARDRAGNQSSTSGWVSVHGALNGMTALYGMTAGTNNVVPDGIEGDPILWQGNQVQDQFNFPLTLASSGATANVVRPARGLPTTSTTSVLAADGTSDKSAVADASPVLAHAAQEPQTTKDGNVVEGYPSRVPGFTASAWVKVSNADADTTRTVLAQLSEPGTPSSSSKMSFDIGYDRGRFVGRVFDPNGKDFAVSDEAPTSPARTSGWWHVALSYRAAVPASGTTPGEPARMELITLRESSTSLTPSDQVITPALSAPATIRPTRGPLVVSHASSVRGRWVGPIDDVRAWQGMATPSQVFSAAKASN